MSRRLLRWGLVLGLSVAAGIALAVAATAADRQPAVDPSLNESVTPSDSISTAVGQSNSVADSVTPADSVTTAVGQSSSVADSVTPSDSVTTAVGQSSSVADSVTPADSVTTSVGQSRSVTESVAPADAVTFQTGVTHSGSETVPVHDSFSFEIVNTRPGLVLPATLHGDEGSPLGGSGSFVDPDLNQSWSATVDWGDGNAVGALTLASNKTFQLDHVYDDNRPGGYTITIVLTDGIASTSGTVHVDIANVPPAAQLANDGPVNEGSPATITFTNPSDPSHADAAAGFTYAVDCGAGYGAATPNPAAQCAFDDNATYVVKGKILDKDGGATELTTSVVVNDVAPTATFNGPATVAEGSPATFNFSNPADPSHADTVAGFTYAIDCGSGYGAATASPTGQCTFDDDGSYAVHGRILDKDGGFTDYAFTLTVTNVAPTATFIAPQTVDEGSAFALSMSGAFDPSAADIAAGFAYAFDCGDGGGFGPYGAAPTGTCVTTDNGSQVVHGAIRDKDGGVSIYAATVSVLNVAPTATFFAPATSAEGSPITLTFSNPSDPSAPDTAAGFKYAFNCGAGFGAPSASPSGTCTLDDGPAADVVKGRIFDKDGGFTEYNLTVNVTNVAPTATFSGPAAVDEGSPGTFAFGSVTDPSAADAAAGFHYQFDCGSGTLGPGTASPSMTCVFDDGPSTQTVAGRVTDKDGGFTDFTVVVTVGNVAPHATFSAPSTVDEGSPIQLALTGVTDPSAADAAAGFAFAFDCGTGGGLGAYGASPTASCPTNDNGSRTVQGAIKDKDGGVRSYTATVNIRNVAPTATISAPATLAEGQTYTLGLTNPSDPSSADTAAGFHYAFNCGGGYSAPQVGSSTTCTAVNDPGVDVKAKIIDKDGGSTEYTAHVAIANVAPAVRILTPPAGSAFPVGTTLHLTGSFTDPGVLDTHTAQWSFDALTAAGAVTESHGSGTVTGDFTFTSPGVYSVTLTVTDSSGGVGTANTVGGAPEMIAIFDPSHGECSGAGWVTPDGTKKTLFAFGAKYVSGTLLGAAISVTLPNGQVFAGTKVRWLVVSGGRCQLRGDGLLAGQSGYSFLITASPTPGAFRVKIWRTSDGTVVFDNVPGASDDIDLASPQPLAWGAVIIR